MKKFLFILGMIFSLIAIIAGIFILFNIYFVMSSNNGVLYDGFGTPYLYNEPHSPYTLPGIVFFLGGVSLLKYSYEKYRDCLAKQNNTKGE